MYKHMLLPTDGSERSDKAADQAIKLAKSMGAALTAIHVTPEYPHFAYEESAVRIPASVKENFYEQSAQLSKKFLDKVTAAAGAAGVQCDAVSVHNVSPCDAIVAQAEKSGCDMIVMASHGRGQLSGLMLGSETTKVLAHSKVPVLVLR
jgi:nucleotide-binding universal stress UspA family protein